MMSPSESAPRTRTTVGQHLTAVLSLLATPLLVFIAPANALYLNNQKEFQHQPQVLFPFVGLFFLTVALGIALYALSRHPFFRGLLWAYYLAGPFFLLFGFLQNWSLGDHFFVWVFDTWAGVLAYSGLCLATAFWLWTRFQPRVLAAPFAIFGVILLATEAHSFSTRYQPHPVELTASAVQQWETRQDLPNIYHVIFDGYQADFFPQTLSSADQNDLDGFVLYPNNQALYPSTNLSLPSIFMGQSRPKDLSSVEYMKRAFNSDASFLYWLKQAGYKTLAYAPKVYEFDLGLFDRVTFHQHNPKVDALIELNTATFKRLWLWANSPRLLTRLMLNTEWFYQFGEEDLKLVKNKNFLPFSVPIASYLSFQNYLEQEAELPARGRYTLIHLVIPHQPEVLSSDCSYDLGGGTTSQIEQAGCATKLLVEFVARLKELHRLDDSLVIAHADHGAYDANNKAADVTERVSLNALLLIKPIGAHGPMAVSDTRSSLVDLAPTLLEAAGVQNEFHSEGTALSDVLRAAPVASLD